MFNHSHVTTVVRRVIPETSRITRFELSCPDFWELPSFTPGAHIDVVLPNEVVRQYSLCGDPNDRYRYQIAVLREDLGRGGSIAMHELIRPGAALPVSMPRNLFVLSPTAQHHVFVAGGIGITPFIPMIIELERKGVSYELHYCIRNREDIAFLPMLSAREDRGAVRFYHPGAGSLDVDQLLQSPLLNAHVYCCGPARLLAKFLEATKKWPENNVHYERFGKSDTVIVSPSYEVHLVRSNRTVQVAENQTLAAALMASGAPLKVACEAGVCGTCKVRHVSGSPVHRDLILSAEERLEWMTSCVSGGGDSCLQIDL